ncbi:MAG: hypothetical protein GXY94_00425 [Bacteroidales bacterium]|nr:hypothetical protein [Bacteroidales bacterium]
MKQEFRANGKLLITGEYLVLQGAWALALPLNKGQSMSVETIKAAQLHWQAYSQGKLWFEAIFDNKLNVIKSSDPAYSQRLQNILNMALKQDSETIEKMLGVRVRTELEFDPRWGWGSSSTLLYLLSTWLGINPYKLLDLSFGGSGYDIACAGSNKPIFYRRLPQQTPEIEEVTFNPPFIDRLYLLWLQKKQSSSSEVKAFLQKDQALPEAIEKINTIGCAMLRSQSAEAFGLLMKQHELIISQILKRPTVKELRFSDFDGYIKSLGAWGGDFALINSPLPNSALCGYFADKGFHTLISLKSVML